MTPNRSLAAILADAASIWDVGRDNTTGRNSCEQIACCAKQAGEVVWHKVVKRKVVGEVESNSDACLG